jgi:hypothetical protein
VHVVGPEIDEEGLPGAAGLVDEGNRGVDEALVIFERCIQVTGLPRRSASAQILPGSVSPGFIVSGRSFGPMPSKLVSDSSKPYAVIGGASSTSRWPPRCHLPKWPVA